MRTGVPAGHAGYLHQLGTYATDDELVQLVVPVLEQGVVAADPTFVALHPREAELVRSAMPARSGVVFLSPLSSPACPPASIKSLMESVAALIAGGAQQVRAVNTVPHPGLGVPWEGWRRYEAAVNELLAETPVWALCLYDRRITPPEVLDDIERTHPYLLAPDGSHVRNDRYEDPKAFLLSRPPPPPDPLQAQPPAVELIDADPAQSREAIRRAAREAGLDEDLARDMVTAASEAVTNAAMHGRRPVVVRVWTTSRRLLVAVHDPGLGPRDPYAGLTPGPSAAQGGGGFGLWIVHQLVHASYDHSDGFTIRLAAEQPTDPRHPYPAPHEALWPASVALAPPTAAE